MHKLKKEIKNGICEILSTLMLCYFCAETIEQAEPKKSDEIVMEILNLLKFIFDNLEFFIVYLQKDFEKVINLLC